MKNRIKRFFSRIWAFSAAHPLGTTCSATLGVAIILALVFLLWPGRNQLNQVMDRNDLFITLNKMKRYPVDLPSAKPGDPPLKANIVINAANIAAYNSILGKIVEERKGITTLMIERNRQGHEVMDDDIFPDQAVARGRQFSAKSIYRKKVLELAGEYSDGGPRWRLNAAKPLTREAVTAAENAEEAAFRSNSGGSRDLGEAEVAELEKRKEAARRKVFTTNIARSSLYIKLEEKTGKPFDLGEWSDLSSDRRPTMTEIWDGQMGIWIQQDIVHAIGVANRLGEPGRPGVLDAPIKRLVDITLVPKYVGIDVPPEPKDTAPAETKPPTGTAIKGAGGNNRNMLLLGNFGPTPTGRVSNAVYDVRHVKVSLIVDSARLPEVIDSFSKVNFMTVINVQLTDIDEYEAQPADAQFFYGSNDCVKADLDVETIWFREWTTPLMPNRVKTALETTPAVK